MSIILIDHPPVYRAIDGAPGHHMSNEPTRPRRETWLDWQPPNTPEPEGLLTRDELIATLQRYGMHTHVNELRYWERAGVLPHPVRRWHNGAVRTLYPRWYGYLIRKVQELRGKGYSLPQIRPRVRAYAEHSLGRRSDLFTDHFWHEIDIETEEPYRPALPHWDKASYEEDLPWPPALAPALRELADQQARYTGVATGRIEVRIVDIDGGEALYSLPLADQ